MIPEFPNFVRLSLNHTKEIKEMTRCLPEYSDFNMVSLLSWDVGEDREVSRLNGNLVLVFSDYVTGDKFLSLHGVCDLAKTVPILLEYAECNNMEPCLKLIPEESAELLVDDDRYRVVSDRDNYDYIISLSKIASLEGGGFRNMRRKLKYYNSSYGSSSSIVELDLANEKDVEEILNVFNKRESLKLSNDSKMELEAMKRLLSISKKFDLIVKGVRYKNLLKAFIIIEKSNNLLVGHFWKADTALKGIYHYLLHQCSIEFSKLGFSIMNIEQDLGIKGLRISKKLLQPSYQKKFLIMRKLEPEQTEIQLVHQHVSLTPRPS
jgi:hypothetical protein